MKKLFKKLFQKVIKKAVSKSVSDVVSNPEVEPEVVKREEGVLEVRASDSDFHSHRNSYRPRRHVLHGTPLNWSKVPSSKFAWGLGLRPHFYWSS